MATLQDEIERKRKEIQTDGYSMSIGEFVRMYEDKELDIHPEFQRFFRWTPLQKTKLIESVMLGIPIPSIFVSQREDGVWEVVDGLQRLSTIFEFVGALRSEKDEPRPPSKLLATDYLPGLRDKMWKGSTPETSFSQPQRLAFKREKLDVKIIKKESDQQAKYELFSRLNTLGSSLSHQEVRNCILIMVDRPFFEWLNEIASYKPFQNCLGLSDRQVEQRYDVELALRFLAYARSTAEELASMEDVGEFLTKKMIQLAQDASFDRTATKDAFEKTFLLIEQSAGDDAFRRYNPEKKVFQGGFLVSAFEVVALGVGKTIGDWTEAGFTDANKAKMLAKIKDIWRNEEFRKSSGAGVRGTSRAPKLVPLGEALLKP
ncbi:MAG: DUF262 domain-containing protein [Elusimicrobia bacterium]|nr:DUF262 domain-containing protein [Elusimicrobiota bacterium]